MNRITVSLAAAALVAGLAAQDEKACDVSKTEIRDYCPGCKGWPASDRIEKGACKKCKGRIERAETCIKVFWDCPTIHGKPVRHAKNCEASKDCCKERPSLARVSYFCDACKGKGKKEGDVKHAAEKCEGKIRETCSESTKFPHGGEE